MNLDHIILAERIKKKKNIYDKNINYPILYFPKQTKSIISRILTTILIVIAWLVFFWFKKNPFTEYIVNHLTFTFIVIFLANFCIKTGYSYKYILDPNKRQLIKRIKFFAEEKDVVIAGFNKIKAIGVSKVFTYTERKDKKWYNQNIFNRFLPLNTNDNSYSTQSEEEIYKYEMIAVFGPNNESVTLECSSSMAKMNEKANVASVITGCNYIKCDNNSKLLPNPDGGNTAPVIWVSKSMQQRQRILNISFLFILFIILLFVSACLL